MSRAKAWYAGAFPRQYDKHEPPVLTERKLPSKEWKKKFKCKKGKGDHNWSPVSIHNHLEYVSRSHQGRGWGYYRIGNPLPVHHDTNEAIPVTEMNAVSRVEWRCKACNKLEHESLDEGKQEGLFKRYGSKKLDAYRNNW